MENDKLMHVVGSLYDCTANLIVMGKLGQEALGYACLIDKKDIAPEGAMIGDIPEEEHPKGTAYEGKNHINLVLHSIGIVFFVPMTWDHATGSITYNDVISKFSELAPSNKDPTDWIDIIAKAFNDTTDVSTIYAKKIGQENKYIGWRPTTQPYGS